MIKADHGDMHKHIYNHNKRLCVVFAMRFENFVGDVQKFFTWHRDLAAQQLNNNVMAVLAYIKIIGQSSYNAKHTDEIELNFYDYSYINKRAMSDYISKNNVKVVVFQGASPGEIDTSFFKRLGVRTINTEDSSFNFNSQTLFIRLGKILVRRLLSYNLHDIYIANSSGQVQYLVSRAMIPKSRVRLVKCGIDTDFYVPSPSRHDACQKLGINPNYIWVMAASQSRPVKRIDKLIDVMSDLMLKRPNHKIGFMYVGGGEKLKELHEYANKKLPRGTFYFFGKQSEVQPYYQAASVFVHAAQTESFGLVLVEAMASGLPVVATEAYGPNEIINDNEDNKTGYLIPTNDWDGFCNALMNYIDSPELRYAHGNAARRRAVEVFDIRPAAISLSEHIGALINQ